MVLKVLAVASATATAVVSAQAPEFTQQYMQRLGGSVDTLGEVVAAFDSDAAVLGLERDEALRQLATGGAFGAARAKTMAATILRHQAMQRDQARLEATSPWARPLQLALDHDAELRRQTWADYRVAVPATPGDALFAMAGFLAGWILFSQLADLMGGVLRRLGAGSARSKNAAGSL